MSKLRLAGIIDESVVDGPGLRFVLFSQGCNHHCNGCHNPQTFSLDGGFKMDTEQIIEKIKKNPLLQGVTFSGGEPFLQAKGFAELAQKIHDLGLNVLSYTGYVFEDLLAEHRPDWTNLLQNIDIIIDGPFILEQKSLLLKFKGSENQRIIDVKKSLQSGKTCILDI